MGALIARMVLATSFRLSLIENRNLSLSGFTKIISDIKSPSIKLIRMSMQPARNKEDNQLIILGETSFKFEMIISTETWYKNEGVKINIRGQKAFFLMRMGCTVKVPPHA